jgi:predicted PurR-regulated permease PerM
MEKDRLLALSLRMALLGLFLWMVRSLLVPIALGGLFALLLHPLQRRVAQKLGARARWSPVLLTVGSVVLVVIPMVLIAIRAVSSIGSFLDRDWAEVTTSVQGFLDDRLGSVGEHLRIDGQRIRAGAENLVRQVGGGLAGWLGGIARALPGAIVDLFLFLIALYYLLRDGRALSRWLLRLSPFQGHETEELFESIHETVNGAILGLLATAAVQGGLTMAALFAFGIPGAFLFGVLATVLAFIPMVGTTPITLGAVIYLLSTGRHGAAAIMAVAAVVIGLSDNVVRSWVQTAHTSHIHPLVVLLGIFGGLELFGAAGVFLGPIVAAMGIWTVDTYAHIRLRHTQKDSVPPSIRSPSTEPPAGSGPPSLSG